MLGSECDLEFQEMKSGIFHEYRSSQRAGMWKTKTTCVHVDLPHSREGLLEQKLEVSFVMKEEELHKITIPHISIEIQYQSEVRYHPFTRHISHHSLHNSHSALHDLHLGYKDSCSMQTIKATSYFNNITLMLVLLHNANVFYINKINQYLQGQCNPFMLNRSQRKKQ